MLFLSTIFSLCILIAIVYIITFYHLASLPIILGAIIFGFIYAYLSYRILNRIFSKRGKIIFALFFFIIQLIIGTFLIYIYHQPKDMALITNTKWNFIVNFIITTSFIYAFLMISNCIKSIKKLSTHE